MFQSKCKHNIFFVKIFWQKINNKIEDVNFWDYKFVCSNKINQLVYKTSTCRNQMSDSIFPILADFCIKISINWLIIPAILLNVKQMKRDLQNRTNYLEIIYDWGSDIWTIYKFISHNINQINKYKHVSANKDEALTTSQEINKRCQPLGIWFIVNYTIFIYDECYKYWIISSNLI